MLLDESAQKIDVPMASFLANLQHNAIDVPNQRTLNFVHKAHWQVVLLLSQNCMDIVFLSTQLIS